MIALVPLAAAHVNQAAAIEAEAYAGADPWPRAAFEGEIGSPHAIWLAAIADGEVAGYAGGWIVMEAYHLLNLAVARALRRRGIGRRLLAAILAEASRRGCGRATLEVRPSNTAARRLYESSGFTAAGTRPRHYADGEDALVYWLEL